MRLGDALYMPQLKWKAGECKALSTLHGAAKDQLLPLFRIPPSGGFDPDEKRVLSPLEHVRSFGARLSVNWGRRFCFVDASLIEDEKHTTACNRHPLTELIERARLEGGLASPTFTLKSTPSYLRSVSNFLASSERVPACLRLSLSDLESTRTFGELESFINKVGGSVAGTVLLIDGGVLHAPEAEPLVTLLADRFAVLAPRDTWGAVFWGSTSFPERPKLKAGDVGIFERTDWQLYQSLVKAVGAFSATPMFSDYGLEFPAHYKPVQVAPVAHLRYSTEDDYFIFKGLSTKKPSSYKAIFDVADRLICDRAFAGERFSQGDTFIKELTVQRSKPGNASTWRWASTDHHLSLVLQQLRMLHRIQIGEDLSEPLIERQLQLI